MPAELTIDDLLKATPHPLVPWLSEAQLRAAVAQGKVRELVTAFLQREELIRLAQGPPDGDALRFGFELPHWKDADALLALEILFLIILGGNRSAKSEYGHKRFVQSALDNPGMLMLSLAEDRDSSIINNQRTCWKYLPPHIRKLNNKRDPAGIYKITYNETNGFADGKLTLPNHTQIHYKSYNEDPGECEGWEFGSLRKLVIAVLADEGLRLNWFNMLKRRLRFRPAQLLWCYTPIRGMTPTIKEAVGTSAKTIASKPAELMPPGRSYVKDCPAGEMPYIQVPALDRGRVIYFHSILNPFGPDGRRYYDGVKEDCAGKTEEYIAKIAYGYTRDTIGRACPNFGGWNIIKPEQLPAVGTNYSFHDPAGARNWANIWLRVAPGNPGPLYVYRDWPDVPRYGEWAVDDDKTKAGEGNPDGIAGPAQRSLGWGVARFKQMFLKEEAIPVVVQGGRIMERDPQRRKVIEDALFAEAEDEDWEKLLLEKRDWLRWGLDLDLREAIHKRLIDPRAGENPRQGEHTGTSLIDDFRKEQVDGSGQVNGPRMVLHPAPGLKIEKGIGDINRYLDWNFEQPLVSVMNEPKLYVTENCKQVIWALEHYTAEGGEDGGCKDFMDLLRYACTSNLRHIEPGMVKTRGGGGY